MRLFTELKEKKNNFPEESKPWEAVNKWLCINNKREIRILWYRAVVYECSDSWHHKTYFTGNLHP